MKKAEVKFDKALSDYLDDEECEAASEAVYQLIRSAFTAGWKAGRGLGLTSHGAFDKDVPYEDPGRDRPL